MFDLAAYDILTPSEQGKWLYPKLPGSGRTLGERDKPFGFLMYGRHSTVARDAQREMMDAYAAKQDAGQRVSEAEAEQIQARFFARCTKGWTEGLHIDGREMPYTFDNAFAVWSDQRFRWIIPQAREFIDNDAVFLTA